MITTQVEQITPEKARHYLQKNHNRKLRNKTVDFYAKQMRRGEWHLSHQGIAFNCDGRLLDGQHRLHAICKSGVTVQMLVTRNVPAASQLTMDVGERRSVVDSAKLVHGREVSSHQVAVVKTMCELNSRQTKLSNGQVLLLLDMFSDGIQWAMTATSGNNKGTGSALIRSALLLGFCYEKDLGRLDEFTGIFMGRHAPQGDEDIAALKLREAAMMSPSRGAARRVLHVRAQRCIQAFCDYKPLNALRAKEAVYPFPLVGNVRGPTAEELMTAISLDVQD